MKTIHCLLISVILNLSCNKDEPNKINMYTGLNDIYVYDLKKSTNTNITNSPDLDEHPISFTYDSKKILFTSSEGLFSVNVDGSQPTILSSLHKYSDIEMSNDGKKLVFSQNGILYLMNSDCTNKQKLSTGLVQLWRPIWSKDGLYVVCCSDSGISIVNINGVVEIITKDRPSGWYDWSSDSKKITYSKTEVNGYYQLFVFDVSTKKEYKLTSSHNNYNSIWRPGAEEIIFVKSLTGSGSDLILMSSDGSYQKVIFHQERISSPMCSPDGKRIAFINEDSNIAIIDIDGNNYKVLNKIPGACINPRWSPNGNYLLYHREIGLNK